MAFSTGQAGNAVVRGPSIVGSIEDFDPVIKRGDDYAVRLQKICDRLCGTGPSPVESPEKDAAVPFSVIAQINHRRSAVVEILDRIERSISQLENAL